MRDNEPVEPLDSIAQVKLLETPEQLRALSNGLRQRILELLIDEALTATEVARRLGLPAARVHYHLREMERLGLATLADVRPRRGAPEKFYRAAARTFRLPRSILGDLPREEQVRTVSELLHSLADRASSDIARLSAQSPDESNQVEARFESVFLSREEFKALLGEIARLVEQHQRPTGREGEREWALIQIGYRVPAQPGKEDESTT